MSSIPAGFSQPQSAASPMAHVRITLEREFWQQVEHFCRPEDFEKMKRDPKVGCLVRSCAMNDVATEHTLAQVLVMLWIDGQMSAIVPEEPIVHIRQFERRFWDVLRKFVCSEEDFQRLKRDPGIYSCVRSTSAQNGTLEDALACAVVVLARNNQLLSEHLQRPVTIVYEHESDLSPERRKEIRETALKSMGGVQNDLIEHLKRPGMITPGYQWNPSPEQLEEIKRLVEKCSRGQAQVHSRSVEWFRSANGIPAPVELLPGHLEHLYAYSWRIDSDGVAVDFKRIPPGYLYLGREGGWYLYSSDVTKPAMLLTEEHAKTHLIFDGDKVVFGERPTCTDLLSSMKAGTISATDMRRILGQRAAGMCTPTPEEDARLGEPSPVMKSQASGVGFQVPSEPHERKCMSTDECDEPQLRDSHEQTPEH